MFTVTKQLNPMTQRLSNLMSCDIDAPITDKGKERRYVHPTAQLTDWLFTIFDPKDCNFAMLGKSYNYVACVYQMERCPSSGRLHLQGFIILSRSTRAAGVEKILGGGAHLDRRLGTRRQAIEYCSKSDTRVSDTVWMGTFPSSEGAVVSDYEYLRKSLEDEEPMSLVAQRHFMLMMKHRSNALWYRNLFINPRRDWKTKVLVFYGVTGSGKSYKARELLPDAYWVSAPNKSKGPIWWNDYKGQEDVIIDEFQGWIDFPQLLRMCDEYPLQVHVHGTLVPFLAKRIIITSNSHPEQWYNWEKNSTFDYKSLERRLVMIPFLFRYVDEPEDREFQKHLLEVICEHSF